MWLCVGSTNNDPAVVAQYCIGCILAVNGKYAWSSLKFQITFSLNFAAKNNTFIIAGFPLILQADLGTENSDMGAIQSTLRHGAGNCFSGLDSFRVVKSTFNQVISFIDLKSDGIR